MGRRLYVGNLSYGVTEAELRETFAEAGEVVDVRRALGQGSGS